MKDCFDPRSYGAVADGHSKDTAAVQAAIDAAAAQGGTVRLAGGTFVCGTLYLKSNVALEITNSATLLASPDIADYGTDTHHNRYRNEPELDRCFLFAQDAENVTICGSGVIDGNAAAFPNAGSIYRPMLLRVLRCRNVRVQNLRLLNAAAWATAFLDSDFIWATDLHIENHRNYNGDGLDFDSCRHVWVRGCYIDGTDDNLCLQSSGLPVQDVHISDCAFTSVCVGIRIGLKSIGEISGVVISNCTMRNIWREGIKLECINAPLLVLCGSLNPITKRQLEYGAAHGGVRISLQSEQLAAGYFESRAGQDFLTQIEQRMQGGCDMLIDTDGTETAEDADTAEQLRGQIAEQLGLLMALLLERPAADNYLPMIIGGDTLMGFMQQLPEAEISPLGEAAPGAVLFMALMAGHVSRIIVSKSGGFGTEDLLSRIRQNLQKGTEDEAISTCHAAAGI